MKSVTIVAFVHEHSFEGLIKEADEKVRDTHNLGWAGIVTLSNMRIRVLQDGCGSVEIEFDYEIANDRPAGGLSNED